VPTETPRPSTRPSRARCLIEATECRFLQLPHDEAPTAAGQAKGNCEKIRAAAQEMESANADAVFESACRYIVRKSLPGWMDEIYAELDLRSTR
jgi:hypothetical protein